MRGVQQSTPDGGWKPAVPLPLVLTLHLRCACGRRFWGRIGRRWLASRPVARYEKHYREEHR